MKTIPTQAKLRSLINEWRLHGDSVALVPTMGALHEGHLSLVKLAKEQSSKVVVSLFVNPKQFGAGEDLDLYPRDEAGDFDKLAQTGADLVYTPSVTQMYPPGFSTNISISGVTNGLCGGSRPGHFDGVATVVTKLLLQTLPDIAIFGEKDFQQLMVINRLATDLDIPVKIMGAPIVREKDGLALSSRNRYLTPIEREAAPLIFQTLTKTATHLKHGIPMKEAIVQADEELTKAGFRLDYFELRDAPSLAPLERLQDTPARLLIAAYLGSTRLIDNIAVIG